MRNTLCNCHYSPSQTSFGCVEITLSVCSTLYAIVFGPYPSYRKLWKSLLHTNIAYDTRMCHVFFFLPKVIWANSRSLEGKVNYILEEVCSTAAAEPLVENLLDWTLYARNCSIIKGGLYSIVYVLEQQFLYTRHTTEVKNSASFIFIACFWLIYIIKDWFA